MAIQPSPLLTSRTFPSSQTQTPFTLNSNSSLLPPPDSGNKHSAVSMNFDYSKYLI